MVVSRANPIEDERVAPDAVVGHGAIMLFLHPTGIGPCRRSCGLEQAMLTFLGQPLYNLILGLAWVALGLSLMAFLIFLRVRR